MKKAFVIVGPTAVGKTAAAVALAQKFNTEIISADSRQCYREPNIGVARPSPGELAAIPHHFIASHSIHEPFNAGQFEQQSLQKAGEIFSDHDELVLVGGTGLYIKAFCEGLDEIPSADPDTRQQVIHGYETNGMDWLREQIREKDSEFFGKGETQNPRRMMRALEVVLSTGRSIFSFRNQEKKKRDFEIIKLGLQLPKEKLVENISVRTERMVREGLVEEARTLMPFRELGPLQTVGYAEMFDHLDGKISLEKAIELIKTHTWQYAKRQFTWFRKDVEIKWGDNALDLYPA
jgi:tRNA dimethylallyltransferase